MLLRDEPTSDDEWYPIWKAHPIGPAGISTTESGQIYTDLGYRADRAAKRAGRRQFVVPVDRNSPPKQRQLIRGEGTGRSAHLVREWTEREQAETEESALTERAERVRQRRWQMRTERPEQPAFRAGLNRAYGGRCVISGVSAPSALEAAHIEPYANGGPDDMTNGLLLRADLHKLFDDLLLWTDDDLTVRVAESIADEEYRRLDGWRLRPPTDRADEPDAVVLRVHRRACQLEQAARVSGTA
ncbi:HNH endonuclease [Actinoplanes sp. NPDC026619]|uniref:HNH endonuclease n=1 Tax=Actinoplanes sp. NPDC026619 TaxID=3155798 RepID=UPI0033FE4DCC